MLESVYYVDQLGRFFLSFCHGLSSIYRRRPLFYEDMDPALNLDLICCSYLNDVEKKMKNFSLHICQWLTCIRLAYLRENFL